MMRSKTLAAVAGLLLLCQPRLAVAEEQAPSDQLRALLDEVWEFGLVESPTFATSLGDRRFNDRLAKVSPADSARRHEQNKTFAKRLAAIDRKGLTPAEQVNFDMMARQLRDDAAEFEFKSYLTPIDCRSGFHIEFPELRRDVPLGTVED